jgi:hypothetical protein
VGGGGQHGGFDALDYRKIRQGKFGKLGTYEFFLFCLTSLRGFFSSFTLINSTASISPSYPQTEVILSTSG